MDGLFAWMKQAEADPAVPGAAPEATLVVAEVDSAEGVEVGGHGARGVNMHNGSCLARPFAFGHTSLISYFSKCRLPYLTPVPARFLLVQVAVAAMAREATAATGATTAIGVTVVESGATVAAAAVEVEVDTGVVVAADMAAAVEAEAAVDTGTTGKDCFGEIT